MTRIYGLFRLHWLEHEMGGTQKEATPANNTAYDGYRYVYTYYGIIVHCTNQILWGRTGVWETIHVYSGSEE